MSVPDANNMPSELGNAQQMEFEQQQSEVSQSCLGSIKEERKESSSESKSSSNFGNYSFHKNQASAKRVIQYDANYSDKHQMKSSESSELNAVSKSSNPNSDLSFSKEEVKRDQKKEQKQ